MEENEPKNGDNSQKLDFEVRRVKIKNLESTTLNNVFIIYNHLLRLSTALGGGVRGDTRL